MTRPAIRVNNLSKQFQLGALQQRHDTFREALTHAITAPLQRLAPNREHATSSADTVWALKDVGFEVQPGEVVGIIGRNGAGKSTLLKILSRITEPTSGEIEIRGRVASLLEVGTGFHPELTGRENVYLNGAILGMTRREIERKFDEIVSFAEVEKFIDTPVKRYSSGMYLRLAFSVAIHIQPHSFLIDEVLAVGDVAFVNKCMAKVAELKSSGIAVVVVSHNMWHIQTVCDRALVFRRGHLTFAGNVPAAIARYREDCAATPSVPGRTGRLGCITPTLNVDLQQPLDLSSLTTDASVRAGFCYADTTSRPVTALVRVTEDDNLPVFTSYSPVWHSQANASVTGVLHIPRLSLLPGDYRLWVTVCGSGLEDEKLAEETMRFTVVGGDRSLRRYGHFDNPVNWVLPE